MTQKEILSMGRRRLARIGHSEQFIGDVLPFWADGFKRGVASTKPKKLTKRRTKT